MQNIETGLVVAMIAVLSIFAALVILLLGGEQEVQEYNNAAIVTEYDAEIKDVQALGKNYYVILKNPKTEAVRSYECSADAYSSLKYLYDNNQPNVNIALYSDDTLRWNNRKLTYNETLQEPIITAELVTTITT